MRVGAGDDGRVVLSLVESNVKPLINVPMDRMVLVANLLRSHPFLERFGLSGSTVLIGATNENRVVASCSAEPRVAVSAEDTTDDVP